MPEQRQRYQCIQVAVLYHAGLTNQAQELLATIAEKNRAADIARGYRIDYEKIVAGIPAHEVAAAKAAARQQKNQPAPEDAQTTKTKEFAEF